MAKEQVGFTQGPWEALERNEGFLIFGPTGYIATVDACLGDKSLVPENRANARLIAAAPDLYTALKEIIDLGNRGYTSEIVGYDEHGHPLDQMGMARKQAEEALARALGKGE